MAEIDIMTQTAPYPRELARAHDSELAGLIDELVLYRAGARLIRREITYGPWRYVTPREIGDER